MDEMEVSICCCVCFIRTQSKYCLSRVGLLIANWLYFVNVSCYAFGVTTAAFAEGPLCTQGLIHQAVA